MQKHAIPLILSTIFVAMSLWAGISPNDRAVWYAETTPLFIVFLALVFTYKKFKFSNTAYILMSVWLLLHTIGAKYTFAAVPFEWGNEFLTPIFGEERNHFDRLAHFSIGFYAFAMSEWLLRKHKCTFGTALWFGLFFMMSVAGAYEIIEWLYAVIKGGNAGIEFLGSQGDIWDAQKDMLCDTLGAIFSLILYIFIRPDKQIR
ncbi:DUF2238 domain-containing protein [Campylobacter sp. CS_NA1]|uniref:DUF2238 domain-containing protein n=1 Tax=Campylobacter sp. CS_NA1 TaxID=2984139 RepID=UPI0022EA0590|nr:DUF2238 domain-containing protein [Campylobacter sp. CS_NA1]MDA3081132.1 DUF2238 domain-containing protein [Campylobacter sp. CS_NA1]